VKWLFALGVKRLEYERSAHAPLASGILRFFETRCDVSTLTLTLMLLWRLAWKTCFVSTIYTPH
jgi:hypothetical protein